MGKCYTIPNWGHTVGSYAAWVEWLHSVVCFHGTLSTFLISFSTSTCSRWPLVLAVPLLAPVKTN